MLLQETIAANLRNNNKVFVAYYDVAKAFDGVWIDGLFSSLRNMGVVGKTWRLLYKSYTNFKCKVRIQKLHSEWYVMKCGIHQGGYLSLMKYTAFINSLLVSLEDSNLCCEISLIKTSPLGYADDVASACTSKNRLDRVMTLVNQHINRWRYRLNAKKCAVLVYGESRKENDRNSKDRFYKLGKERVYEKKTYDHVGLKNCISGDFSTRIDEKISKGRKALCASTGIGIKTGGLTQKLCCFIYWTIIVPIITYAAEMWVLNDHDIEKLDKVHRYAGRKLQRLNCRSATSTSYECLGWMRLENFIYAKKLLFARTCAIQDMDSIYRRVFMTRMLQFNENIEEGVENIHFSPIFDILRISILYGLYEDVCKQICGTVVYSEKAWKTIVWARAWEIERDAWKNVTLFFNNSRLLNNVMDEPGYTIWWQISDVNYKYVRYCEVMIKIICRASRLKSDYFSLEGAHFSERSCTRCDNFAYEDVRHIILQCECNIVDRNELFRQINEMPNGVGKSILDRSDDFLSTLLGKFCPGIDKGSMFEFWKISCIFVSMVYWSVVNDGRIRKS